MQLRPLGLVALWKCLFGLCSSCYCYCWPHCSDCANRCAAAADGDDLERGELTGFRAVPIAPNGVGGVDVVVRPHIACLAGG